MPLTSAIRLLFYILLGSSKSLIVPLHALSSKSVAASRGKVQSVWRRNDLGTNVSKGSIYCPLKDSGSKKYTRYGFWNQNPEIGDLLGFVLRKHAELLYSSAWLWQSGLHTLCADIPAISVQVRNKVNVNLGCCPARAHPADMVAGLVPTTAELQRDPHENLNLAAPTHTKREGPRT